MKERNNKGNETNNQRKSVEKRKRHQRNELFIFNIYIYTYNQIDVCLYGKCWDTWTQTTDRWLCVSDRIYSNKQQSTAQNIRFDDDKIDDDDDVLQLTNIFMNQYTYTATTFTSFKMIESPAIICMLDWDGAATATDFCECQLIWEDLSNFIELKVNCEYFFFVFSIKKWTIFCCSKICRNI